MSPRNEVSAETIKRFRPLEELREQASKAPEVKAATFVRDEPPSLPHSNRSERRAAKSRKGR